jgi:glycine/D-amino acid oxidase-like deaminating enzyme
MTKTTDYLILGAGVIGTSIAFQLAQRKAGRIAVIDKSFAGQGNSGRSSALIRMHYAYAPEVQLAVLGYKIFANWEEIVGRPTHFRRTGFVRIAKREYADRLRANVSMQRENGANTRIISATELKEMEPDWNTDDFDIAAYEPDSGYGDGAAVATDFLSRAREMGVEYQPQTFAKSIDVEAGRVVGVTTDRGEISAGAVVIATGPWTQPLLAPHGVALPIEPEFHVVAMLENPPGMEGRGLTCIDGITETYFRREGSDMTLVGEFYGETGVDPDDFPQSSSAEEMARMVGSACRRVPALQEAGVARSVTGIYDKTPDARPMLGRVPGLDGAYCAVGLSGMGFKLSPAVGIAMSELMLDGKGTSIDIDSFAPGRFAAGKPIKAAHEYAGA